MSTYSEQLAAVNAEIAAKLAELEALRAERRELERCRLYEDIIGVWLKHHASRIALPSSTIRDLLRSMDDRPYADWESDVVGQRQLGAALGDEVTPQKVRGAGQRLVQGYRLRDITDALDRPAS